jgi:transcriptional regulator with XRE-family HTH domain
MALIDLKILLIEKLKETRVARKVTQQHLVRLINSSQSRVAMLERGRPDVSLDLICRALFALGVGRNELARPERVEGAKRSRQTGRRDNGTGVAISRLQESSDQEFSSGNIAKRSSARRISILRV